MIGIVVTGHGAFAGGMTAALNLIAGEQEAYASVDFTPDLSPAQLSERLCAAMDATGGEGILLLCDLAGGTPFNEAAKLLAQGGRPLEIIAGVNLPTIINACMERDGHTAATLAEEMETFGRGQLMRLVLPAPGGDLEVDD